MGFFSLHKPLQYKYRYIYYDPKKEAQKEREQKMNDRPDEQDGGYKRIIQRGTFREMANQRRGERRSSVMSSNIRLVVIIVILLLVMYFLIS
ncbi:MAG: hypothetical protein BGP01_01155 [Paludibacter sp. 47-17]|jgi:hypothetical protein|nr:MAG: hypothetical protein F9K10_03565 [Paludibacter sp.]OJX88938.1 MAG: hypothetical protein BGP01_01155 [Paludibacter sp. 47-17]